MSRFLIWDVAATRWSKKLTYLGLTALLTVMAGSWCPTVGAEGSRSLVADPSVPSLGRTSPDDEVPEKPTPLTNFSGSRGVVPDLFAGSARASVPLLLPVGRAGVKPNIAISYHSAGTATPYGVGWNLSLGEVRRVSRFGVEYSQESYEFVGSEGVTDLVVTDAGAREFKAKLEREFTRFRKIVDGQGQVSWLATDRNGTVYEFGRSANGRIRGVNDGEIFSWSLESIVDPNGNAISYSYVQDDGLPYISSINYTLDMNGKAPALHFVNFSYESRPDPQVSYTSGSRVGMRQRLREIAVISDGKPFANYVFEYKQSSATGRSLLQAILHREPTGNLLALAGMHYQDQQFAFNSSVATWWRRHIVRYSAESRYLTGDFDGNGATDAALQGLCCVNGDAADPNDPNGSVTIGKLVPPDANEVYRWGSFGFHILHGPYVYAGDFTGDGRSDILAIGTPPRYGRAFVLPGGHDLAAPLQEWTPSPVEHHLPQNIFVGDFTGDGLDDVVRLGLRATSDSRIFATISKGNRFASPAVWSNGVVDPDGARYRTADLNGDGRRDIAYLKNDGSQQIALASKDRFTNFTTWTTFPANSTICYADFNGDGLDDALAFKADGKISVALSSGLGLQPASEWIDTRFGSNGGFQLYCRDMNGDHRSDVLLLRTRDLKASVFSSSGSAFLTQIVDVDTKLGAGDMLAGSVRVVDVDGSGTLDIAASYLSGQRAVLSTSSFADLLSDLVLPHGGVTSLSYTSSANFNNTQLPYALPVLSSISYFDGLKRVATFKINYRGGYFHVRNREFRGFRTVAVSGPRGSSLPEGMVVLTFHQGSSPDIDNDNPEASTAFLMGRVAREEAFDQDAHLIARSSFLYDISRATGPQFLVTMATRIEEECDAAGCKGSRSEFTHDEYGNELTRIDLATTSGTPGLRTTTRTFVNDKTTWILGRRESEKVVGSDGTVLSFSSWCYDPQGQVTEVRAYPTDSPVELESCTTSPNSPGRTNTAPYVSNQVERDRFSNVVALTDGKGASKKIVYDRSSTLPVQIVDRVGRSQRIEYFGFDGIAAAGANVGRVKALIDASNNRIEFMYDGFGRPVRTTEGDGGITEWSYAPIPVPGQISIVGSKDGRVTSEISLDGFGRLWRSARSGPEGKWVESQVDYNEIGKIGRISDPYFRGENPRWTSLFYDTRGRTTMVSRDGAVFTQCYEGFRMGTADSKGTRTVTEFDVFGRRKALYEYSTPSSACDPNIGAPTSSTTFVYDDVDRLTSYGNSAQSRVAIEYDALGRRMSVSRSGRTWKSFLYDANGNVVVATDALGRVARYTFNPDDQLLTAEWANSVRSRPGEKAIWEYEGGHLAKASAAGYTREFSYDQLGRIKSVKQTGNWSTMSAAFAYTTDGALSEMRSSDGQSLQYRYDAFAVSGAELNGKTLFAASSFDADGRPMHMRFANGVTEDREFKGTAGRLSRIQIADASGRPFKEERYDYLGFALKGRASATGDETYTYDGLGRIESVTSANGVQNFKYGPLGEMVNHARLGPIAYRDPNHPFAPTSVAGTSFTYDAVGSRVSMASGKTSASYEYDETSQLSETKVTTTSGRKKTTSKSYFRYGPNGLVIERGLRNAVGIPVDRHIYLGEEQTRIAGDVYLSASDGEQRVVFARANRCTSNSRACISAEYLHRDFAGNVVAVSDSNGKLTSTQGDVFGGGANGHGSYGFAGYEYLNHLQLHSSPARFYDQEIGQFITQDPFISDDSTLQGQNPYEYGLNNPTQNRDSLGLYADSWSSDVGSITMPFPGAGGGGGFVFVPIFSGGRGSSTAASSSNPYTANVAYGGSAGNIVGLSNFGTAQARSGGTEFVYDALAASVDALAEQWSGLHPGAKLIVGGAASVVLGAVAIKLAIVGGVALGVAETVAVLSGALSASSGFVTLTCGAMMLPMERSNAARQAESISTAMDLAGGVGPLVGGVSGLVATGGSEKGLKVGAWGGQLMQLGLTGSPLFFPQSLDRSRMLLEGANFAKDVGAVWVGQKDLLGTK